MTREEAFALFSEHTNTITEDMTFCSWGCGCVYRVWDEGEDDLWFDRFVPFHDMAHDCECHVIPQSLTKHNKETA